MLIMLVNLKIEFNEVNLEDRILWIVNEYVN